MCSVLAPKPKKARSALVVRLLAISWWSILAAVVVFAIVFGLGVGVIVAAVFAGVYAGVQRAFGDRITERFERRPELRLLIAHGGALIDVVEAGARPWPNDPEKIVAHEIQCLQKEAEGRDQMARRPALGSFLFVTDPFQARPRTEDYDAALHRFHEELAEHERDLREWLVEYNQAALARSEIFELELRVRNDKAAAYAEDVRLEMELPGEVGMVEGWPTISPPPAAPAYVAPQPRSLGSFAMARPYLGIHSMPFATAPPPSLWDVSGDGRRVLAALGNIHHDTVYELGQLLFLRARGAGRHVVRWTLRARNGRRHCTGELVLVVAPNPMRPPFTRLHGVECFPDVPFVDDDGEVTREARAEDPPTLPPQRPASESALAWLLEGGEYNEWVALGLSGPAEHADDDTTSVA
jgi:hypothetical protein